MQKYTKNLKKKVKKKTSGLRTIKLFHQKMARCSCSSTKTDYRQAGHWNPRLCVFGIGLPSVARTKWISCPWLAFRLFLSTSSAVSAIFHMQPISLRSPPPSENKPQMNSDTHGWGTDNKIKKHPCLICVYLCLSVSKTRFRKYKSVYEKNGFQSRKRLSEIAGSPAIRGLCL